MCRGLSRRAALSDPDWRRGCRPKALPGAAGLRRAMGLRFLSGSCKSTLPPMDFCVQ